MGYVLILVGWLFFGLIHSLTASLWLKQKIAHKLGRLSSYCRLMYNVLAISTLLPVLWLHHTAPIEYITRWHGSIVLGSIVLGLGVLAVFFAFRGYDLAEIMGWPVKTNVSSDQQLRQDGLLQYVRHPLYTAIIVSLLGIWFIKPTWSYLILLLAATLYIRIGIYFEEKKLVDTFGKAYVRYRQHVPMLFPHVRGLT